MIALSKYIPIYRYKRFDVAVGDQTVTVGIKRHLLDKTGKTPVATLGIADIPQPVQMFENSSLLISGGGYFTRDVNADIWISNKGLPVQLARLTNKGVSHQLENLAKHLPLQVSHFDGSEVTLSPFKSTTISNGQIRFPLSTTKQSPSHQFEIQLLSLNNQAISIYQRPGQCSGTTTAMTQTKQAPIDPVKLDQLKTIEKRIIQNRRYKLGAIVNGILLPINLITAFSSAPWIATLGTIAAVAAPIAAVLFALSYRTNIKKLKASLQDLFQEISPTEAVQLLAETNNPQMVMDLLEPQQSQAISNSPLTAANQPTQLEQAQEPPAQIAQGAERENQ